MARYFPTTRSRVAPRPSLDRWWVGVVGDGTSAFLAAVQIASGAHVGRPRIGPVPESRLPAVFARLQARTGLPLYDEAAAPMGFIDGIPVPNAAALWFQPVDWDNPSI